MAGELGFTPEGPHIEEVTGLRRVHNEEHGEKESSGRHAETSHHEKRHPKEYLNAITKAAEASNDRLAKKGAPYRFRVYDEEGKVMIDLVMLDDTGKIVKEVKRNITDDDFDRLIENISAIEGLFIDRNG